MRRADFTYTHCYCEENVFKVLEKLVLAAEVERRKEAKLLGQDAAAVSATTSTSGESSGGVGAATTTVDTRTFDRFAALWMSAWSCAVDEEKKNVWDSQFPLCTRDVDAVVSSSVHQGDPYVVWDYHVVALLRHRSTRVWYVLDLDTRIGQPDPMFPDSLVYAVRVDLYLKLALTPNPAHATLSKVNMRRAAFAVERVRLRVVEASTYLATLRSDRTHMLIKSRAGAVPEYQSPPPAGHCILAPSPILSALKPDEGKSLERLAETQWKGKFAWRNENNLASFINNNNSLAVPGHVVPANELQDVLVAL